MNMSMSSIARRVRRGLTVCAATVTLTAGLALAQNEPAPKPAQDDTFKGGTVFVVDHVALDKLFSDPKDKAFGAALGMVPARINELPDEIPDMPPEAVELIQTVLKAVVRPGRLTVSYDESPTGGFFGYGLALSVHTADKAEAESMQKQVAGLLEQAPNMPRTKASTRFKGMTDLQTPVGIVTWGPREAKDGWRYEIIVGTMTDPDIGAAALPAPAKGLDVLARGRLDLAGLTPAADMAQMFMGAAPEIQELRTFLVDMGLIGSKAMKLSFQMGRSETESITLTTVEGVGRVADMMGISRAPLDPAVLGVVPADSASASISRMGLSWINKLIDKGMEESEEFAGAMSQVKEMTKVDLQQEIIASLGDQMALYTSDSTGGGGMASAVLMVSLKDSQKFSGGIGKLADFVNGMSKQHARGYVRLAKSGNRDGATWYSLQFPGVPVPLELSMAITDKWLVMAPTPQALTVAVRQATGKGDAGLTANPVFAGAFPKGVQFASVSFTDTARSMKDGYGLLTMIGSAVSNLVRSPTDPAREAGMVVPLFNDLKKGARPTIKWAMWKGDDYAMESHSDRSMLVNASSSLGNIAGSMSGIVAQIISAAGQGARRGGVMAPRLLPERIREAGIEALSAADSAGALLQRLYSEAVPVFGVERE